MCRVDAHLILGSLANVLSITIRIYEGEECLPALKSSTTASLNHDVIVVPRKYMMLIFQGLMRNEDYGKCPLASIGKCACRLNHREFERTTRIRLRIPTYAWWTYHVARPLTSCKPSGQVRYMWRLSVF